jgi:tetratricopeptide (TPR) repeat protein
LDPSIEQAKLPVMADVSTIPKGYLVTQIAAGTLQDREGAAMAALQGGRTDDSALSRDLVHHSVSAPAARVFRLLSMHPGPDAPTAAVAVMAGLSVSEAHGTLASLSRAHVVEPVPDSRERWRMPDLVRAQAQRLSDEHAAADGREQAMDRLLCYYQATTEAADGWLRGLPPIPVEQNFTDRDGALAWLDAERDSLIAAARMAFGAGRDQAAKSLPLLMSYYLNFRRLFAELLTVATVGLDAARRLGDRAAEGESLNNRGAALIGLKRYDEALAVYEDAAALFRELGDRRAEGETLNNRGAALIGLRRYDEALAVYEDAVALFRELRDPHEEGASLNNVGIILHALRQNDEARAACQKAVAIFRDTGDRHGLAMALGNLGNVSRSLGHAVEAAEIYQEAADIFRVTGDHSREIAALESVIAVRAAL